MKTLLILTLLSAGVTTEHIIPGYENDTCIFEAMELYGRPYNLYGYEYEVTDWVCLYGDKGGWGYE